MQRLQPYINLKRIYKKSVNPWIAVTVILAVIAAVLSVLQIMYAHNYNILFYLIFPVVFSVVWITRRNTAKRSLSHFSDSGLARLNDEIDAVQKAEGFCVTSEALAATQNQLFALPINDVVWIYSRVTTGRIMFIPAVSSYDIVVVSRHKKKYYLKGRLQGTDQAYILQFLQNQLCCVRGGILFGYTEELNNLYYRDFEQMVAVSDGMAVFD